VSFLRKQEARLLCACYGVPVDYGHLATMGFPYVLDCRFRGNDTHPPALALRLASRRPGERPVCSIRLK